MTTLACVAGGIVCEGNVLVAEPPWGASRLRRSNFVQTILPATQAMTTSEHYSTNVQTFVAEDSRSDNFRRLPNVAVRSSKPWRDLVSFLLRTSTQHLAPFTGGQFCLESDLHFSRNLTNARIVFSFFLRYWRKSQIPVNEIVKYLRRHMHAILLSLHTKTTWFTPCIHSHCCHSRLPRYKITQKKFYIIV